MRGPEGGRPCKRFVKRVVSKERTVRVCTESRWPDESKSAGFDNVRGISRCELTTEDTGEHRGDRDTDRGVTNASQARE